MRRKRSVRQMHLMSLRCKERNHAHPNMVLVHDRSDQSSFINLFEGGDRWSTLTPAPFFPGWIAFQNFHLVSRELGGKKLKEKKKVRKQVAQKGPAS
jgi:hypothetical protein